MKSRVALFALAAALAAPSFATQPAPVADLVGKVDIPFDQFTLANGLRVVVHTDRKAPVVAVSVWYHVGSKDEPKGKTGFAHLFEHLMFAGSENVANFDNEVIALGGANNNGTTWYDRTNYFQTVPTASLDRMLFIEADRMGRLLGAVTQERLDNQRGVVQNEKRQGDNQPFGQVEYFVSDALFPAGHPYRHSTIGSMADLDAASLDTVKNWFRANYGPDNAVLVLAGDIDAATARPLIERHFGGIARGPAVTRIAAAIPTLPATRSLTIRDRVPYTRVARYWAIEGVNGRDTTALGIAASALGGLASSRLDNALVRGDALAISVSAGVQAFEKLGQFVVSADVKPGGDATEVERRLDALIADFIAKGPTGDEVQRVATKSIAGTIAGYEAVGGFGGKATALAEGLVYSNDPAKYKAELAELAAATPASVRAAMQRWLTRPVLKVSVVNGDRDTSSAALAITGDTPGAPSTAAKPPEGLMPARTTLPLPTLGTFAPLAFPAIERATLTNGIPVYLARRSNIPTVRVAVTFDAGSAADPQDALGLQSLTMALLDEGTTTRSSIRIAEDQERLGATISAGGGLDRSSVGLYALTANLVPSLDLLADVVRNPAFDPKEVERLRNQQLAGIAAQQSQPQGIANIILPGKLYGDAYPYARPFSGLGTTATVKTLTREAVVQFARRWLRPDGAAIFVVGDTTMAAIRPLLDERFGKWPSDRMARPIKAFTAPIPPPAPTKIWFADRPGSPQSVIAAGQVLGVTGRDPSLLVLGQANDVLGGSFVSRLNLDLRETKGWSYGVRSGISGFENRVPYTVSAPVQADRTGDSVKAVLANIRAFLTTKGTTAEERTRTIDSSIRELPGQFETSDAVLGAMQRIVFLGRPDNYFATLADRYRAMTAADFDKAVRAAIDPDRFAIVVVGDAKTVRPQLDKLGIPIEQVQLPAAQ